MAVSPATSAGVTTDNSPPPDYANPAGQSRRPEPASKTAINAIASLRVGDAWF